MSECQDHGPDEAPWMCECTRVKLSAATERISAHEAKERLTAQRLQALTAERDTAQADAVNAWQQLCEALDIGEAMTADRDLLRVSYEAAANQRASAERERDGLRAELEAARMKVRGKNHTGMRVSVSGLLGRIAGGERLNKGTRYMIGELLKHLEQVGREYYAGNIAIVDEFLQCYALDDNRATATRKDAP